MDKPIRIQRKRTKGWKMPPNTVYVGRPSKWGNPYPVGNTWNTQEALTMFKLWADKWLDEDDLKELRGKNLSCWCPIGSACHADYLLEICNKEHNEQA